MTPSEIVIRNPSPEIRDVVRSLVGAAMQMDDSDFSSVVMADALNTLRESRSMSAETCEIVAQLSAVISLSAVVATGIISAAADDPDLTLDIELRRRIVNEGVRMLWGEPLWPDPEAP